VQERSHHDNDKRASRDPRSESFDAEDAPVGTQAVFSSEDQSVTQLLDRSGHVGCEARRDGAYDSRGRLTGKRPIADRPLGAEHRSRFGHWEGDTMLGAGQAGPCVLTLVERKSGFVVQT
jgi:IS30 family transposase